MQTWYKLSTFSGNLFCGMEHPSVWCYLVNLKRTEKHVFYWVDVVGCGGGLASTGAGMGTGRVRVWYGCGTGTVRVRIRVRVCKPWSFAGLRMLQHHVYSYQSFCSKMLRFPRSLVHTYPFAADGVAMSALASRLLCGSSTLCFSRCAGAKRIEIWRFVWVCLKMGYTVVSRGKLMIPKYPGILFSDKPILLLHCWECNDCKPTLMTWGMRPSDMCKPFSKILFVFTRFSPRKWISLYSLPPAFDAKWDIVWC